MVIEIFLVIFLGFTFTCPFERTLSLLVELTGSAEPSLGSELYRPVLAKTKLNEEARAEDLDRRRSEAAKELTDFIRQFLVALLVISLI